MTLRRPFLTGFSILLAATSLSAKPKPGSTPAPAGGAPKRDDVVRLQIYLDEQNFSPGKIDGRYGGFTAKSWQRYQQSQDMTPSDRFDAKTSPLTSVDPIYVTYTVNKDDLSAIGTMPKELAEQAKNKVLPYTSMAELLGERYHVGVDFLRELNKGKNLDQLKEGDTVKAPNVVPPFNLAQVIALKTYTAERAKVIKETRSDKEKGKPSDAPAGTPPAEMPGPTVPVSASPPPAADVPKPTATSPTPSPSPSPTPDEGETDAPAAATAKPVLRAVPADAQGLVFHVSTKDDYLEVRDGDRLVACFPITPGSTAIPTPKGEWHVVAKTLLPEFRWDKSVLMTGKRSTRFLPTAARAEQPGGHHLDRAQQAGHRDARHGGAGHHRPLGQPRMHPVIELGRVQGVRHGRTGHKGHHRIKPLKLFATLCSPDFAPFFITFLIWRRPRCGGAHGWVSARISTNRSMSVITWADTNSAWHRPTRTTQRKKAR